jgi:hypothetical protein
MVVRDYSASRHDRFYAGGDRAFLAEAYDLSGVGRSGDYWATLVSDSYFLSARHYHAGAGSEVTFWEWMGYVDEAPTWAPHTYTISGGTAISGSDLWVGWFTETVDANITRYPVPDYPSEGMYLDEAIYNYGKSHRVGRNVADGIDDVKVNSTTGRGIYYDYDNTDVPSVDGDETFLQNEDSGGPSFALYGQRLAVLGIHWAITDEYENTNEGEFSVDTFVPFYIDQVNDVLAGGGETLTLVPEPGVLPLVFLSLVWAVGRRSRRHVASD